MTLLLMVIIMTMMMAVMMMMMMMMMLLLGTHLQWIMSKIKVKYKYNLTKLHIYFCNRDIGTAICFFTDIAKAKENRYHMAVEPQ